MDDPVRLELTPDEALVLLEYLHRSEDDRLLDSTFQDQAEQIVLWKLEGQLEKQSVAIFDPRYEALVHEARERLRSPEAH